MAGFLDSKERVIDMVLTDVGKSLLLKGDLRFTYWIPFDDEVDYNPEFIGEYQGGVFVSALDMSGSDYQDARTRKTEDPLVREATMGYRGLAYAEVDTTNVYRPMYSAPPGVGQTYPLLEAAAVFNTNSLDPVTSASLQFPDGVFYQSTWLGPMGNQIAIAYVSGMLLAVSSSVDNISGTVFTVTLNNGVTNNGDVVRAVNGNTVFSSWATASLLSNSGTVVLPASVRYLFGGSLSSRGSIPVVITQQKNSKLYVQYDEKGQTIIRTIGPGDVAFQRKAVSETKLEFTYPSDKNELPHDIKLEGFLVTMYHSSTIKKDEFGQDIGGYEEILQNRDSKDQIVYRNDLALDNLTP